MASRIAQNLLQKSTRSVVVLRRVSQHQKLKSAVKSLQKSTSALHLSPALSSVLQNLGKNSSISFCNNVRRFQDLPTNIDVTTSLLSTNDGDTTQDSMLEQLCGEDDDDQFRTRETVNIVKNEIEIAQKHGPVFAIVQIGGSQFKITKHDVIMVNKINAEVGSRIRLEKVLLVGGENFTIVGKPLVKNTVEIQATVIENFKTPKIIVFKKKRRKNYKRTQGHRQEMSALRINKINLSSF